MTKKTHFEMNILSQGQEKPITSEMIAKVLEKLAKAHRLSLSKVA
ncbi:hypothetical protein [Moraxella nasovis]|nr:hypothetical protein [Moraxella nasovis]